MSKGRGTLLIVLALAVAGCGVGAASTTTPPITTSPPPPITTSPITAAPSPTGPEVLPEFPRDDVVVAGRPLQVAVADTGARRTQGLMGVTDLGELDGMLFVFPADTTSAFWMKDTLIPLDIWFFDAAGTFVDGLTMEPCPADPCPLYQSAGVYRYALESPAGSQAAPGDGAVLELEAP